MVNRIGTFLMSKRGRILLIVVLLVIVGVAAFLLAPRGSKTAQTDTTTAPSAESKVLKAVSNDNDTKKHVFTPSSVPSMQVFGQ